MLSRLFSGDEKLPNKFTRAIGKRIKDAREERGMSQTELGDLIYRRQAAISHMENGRMEPSASTLMLLAAALEKPVMYFFPQPWAKRVPQDSLSAAEQELIMELRQLPELEQRMILEEVKLKRKIAAQIQREQLAEELVDWQLEDEDNDEDHDKS